MIDLAKQICAALKVANCEQREGANRGGVYFQLNVFGLTLDLLHNVGEVEIPERADWQYYMVIYPEIAELDSEKLRMFAEYVAALLRKDGLEAEADCLS